VTLDCGTASAAPGTVDRGWLDATELPTGTAERLPVLLVNGAADGPTLWITAGVHGDEVTGLAAAQDAVDALPADHLAGAVVCLPSVNPAGLRRTARRSYYHDDDPNRSFPDPAGDRTEPPNAQTLVARRLYDRFAEGPLAADALLDLHTAGVGAAPFVIRDRVLYGERRDETAAQALATATEALVESLGLPVVTEFPPETYVERNLQRSLAGAALNGAGVPACTLELGGPDVVDERRRRLGVAAVCRAAVEAGCLDAVPAAAPDVTAESPVDFPVRRHRGPRVDEPGVLRSTLEAGEPFAEGDDAATVVSPTGERRETLTFDRDGYVLGRATGVAAYENDPAYSLAVRDEGALVAPRDADEADDDADG